MATKTNIAWTDHTFNPWIGCSEVSPGCDNCYARQMGRRLGVKWGADEPRRYASESAWAQPYAWWRAAVRAQSRRRVFCASMADVFDKSANPESRERLWEVIWDTVSALDWLLLTKRIGNVKHMMPWSMLRYVWIGASIVNQEEADRDIPKLLDLEAKVRFLSCEPLLGPLDLTDGLGVMGAPGDLDWVIVGGESGPRARPMNLWWADSIIKQCRAACVPVFVKQLGARPVLNSDRLQNGAPVVLRDRKGGDPEEWAAELRVREFPA